MYKHPRLVTVNLDDIRPYDVIYVHGKRYGVNKIGAVPSTSIVELEIRPWLQWKGYLKTHLLVALCAGQCNHGGMHIVTQADKDHTTVRPPKRIKIDANKYDSKPWIKKLEKTS